MITSIDIDALTQFIQSSLASPELIDEELFRDETVAYNDLCYELNTHFAETDRLIDAGRRDEAIEYSERQGNLLEVFERLDLPERDLWCELVTAFELPLPPMINEEAAEQLNDAYAAVGNLTPLLKRHRLLALDRAPVKYRLQTLSELARRDPLNPIWQDNVKAFQPVRLNEIPAELARATATGDRVAIEELNQECRSTQWMVDFPAKLKTQIQTAQQAGKRQTSTAEIERLGNALYQAQQDGDETGAIAIADQIGQQIADADIQSDDPVLQPFAPLLAWVAGLRQQAAQQQRDLEAIEKFKRVLNRAKTPAELEPALESIRAMGSRFPGELRERGKKRLESLKRGVLLKRLLIIGGSLAAILLVMVGVGGYLYFQHREGQLVELDESFQSLIAGESWDEAKIFYDSQTDAVKLRPAFSSGATKVAAAIKSERTRQETMDRLVEEIQADELATSTPSLIKQLRELARTSDDERVIAKQETLYARRKLMMERANAEESGTKLDDIERDLDRLSRATSPDRAGVAALNRRLQSLEPQIVYSGPAVGERADDLQSRITGLIEKSIRAERNEKLQASVTQSVGNLETFTSELNRYVQEIDGSTRDSAWSDLPDRLSRMKRDATWVSLLNDPVFQNRSDASEADLSDWTARFEEASAAVGDEDHFLRSHLKRSLENFKAMSQQASARASLSEFAESSLLQTMYVYIDRDPSRDRVDEPPAIYYSPKSYQSGDPRHRVDFFADYTLAIREKNFGAPKYATMKGLESGHSLFGKWLRKNIGNFKGKQFAPTGVRLLDFLAKMPEDRCDPIFKLSLIRNFMKVLLPASRPLKAGYEPIQTRLNDSSFNWEANWFSPGDSDSEVATARRLATELLSEMDWDAARKRVGESWKRLYGSPPWSVRWVGWWTPLGRESVAMLKTEQTTGELVLFRHLQGPNGTTLSVTPVEIGDAGRSSVVFQSTELQGTTPAVYAIDRKN